MGLIDFATPICVVHGVKFGVFRVCGMDIKGCPICTAPRPPKKKRYRFPYGPQAASIARYASRAKCEAAKSAWQGKSVVFVGKGSQKRNIKRTGPSLPVMTPDGYKYVKTTHTIVVQKYVTGTPWAHKLRKDDD